MLLLCAETVAIGHGSSRFITTREIEKIGMIGKMGTRSEALLWTVNGLADYHPQLIVADPWILVPFMKLLTCDLLVL
jgi:hypothetical protein